MEENTAGNRMAQRGWWTRWLIDHQEGASAIYVRYEPAWTDAWPHVDDWFKARLLLGRLGGNRPTRS